jgi:hypothetical protein
LKQKVVLASSEDLEYPALSDKVIRQVRFVNNEDYTALTIEFAKGGVLLHFNHIATVSTGWHAQNLFESLTFTSRYMYRLAAEIHQIRRV